MYCRHLTSFAIIEFLDVCKILEKNLHFLKTTINFHDLTSLDTIAVLITKKEGHKSD